MTATPSPCISICVLGADNVCEGCGRTIDEISEWPEAAEARRAEIAETAKNRRTRKDGPCHVVFATKGDAPGAQADSDRGPNDPQAAAGKPVSYR